MLSLSLVQVRMLTLSEDMLPLDIYGLKTAPLQTLLLPRLAKLASLIHGYTINPSPLFT